MTNRVKLVNLGSQMTLQTLTGTEAQQNQRGKDGCVAEGSWIGRNVTVGGFEFNRGSLIDCLNKGRQGRFAPNLSKGLFGFIGGASENEIRQAFLDRFFSEEIGRGIAGPGRATYYQESPEIKQIVNDLMARHATLRNSARHSITKNSIQEEIQRLGFWARLYKDVFGT